MVREVPPKYKKSLPMNYIHILATPPSTRQNIYHHTSPSTAGCSFVHEAYYLCTK